MTASKVTPPVNEEGADMEGTEEARRVAVSVRGRFGRSWASLRLMVVVFMAHITGKWRRSLMIAEGKMSLSRVIVFL